MCSICGYTRCPSACPNASDPEPVTKCEWCDEGILPGDECYSLSGWVFHADCLKDNAVDILQEYCGANLFVAEPADNETDQSPDWTDELFDLLK